MPTLCSLAGYRPEQDLKWDGVNISPALLGETSSIAPRTIYTVSPGWRSRALRSGDWKLVVHGEGDKAKQELYVNDNWCDTIEETVE